MPSGTDYVAEAGFVLLQGAIEIVIELGKVVLRNFDSVDGGFGGRLELVQGGYVMRNNVLKLACQLLNAVRRVVSDSKLLRGRCGLGEVRHFTDDNGEFGGRGMPGAHTGLDRQHYRFKKK